jgi:hypothetical protein
MTIIASMSFSEDWSFRILRRIVSGRAFVLSKRLAQLCTVLRLLGQALFAVQTDPNYLWMLLSGNPEVAFLSTTATTTPAENLPMPATAAATAATTPSTTNADAAAGVAVAAAVAVTVPATRAASRASRAGAFNAAAATIAAAFFWC